MQWWFAMSVRDFRWDGLSLSSWNKLQEVPIFFCESLIFQFSGDFGDFDLPILTHFFVLIFLFLTILTKNGWASNLPYSKGAIKKNFEHCSKFSGPLLPLPPISLKKKKNMKIYENWWNWWEKKWNFEFQVDSPLFEQCSFFYSSLIQPFLSCFLCDYIYYGSGLRTRIPT